jgi:hypothetical protein
VEGYLRGPAYIPRRNKLIEALRVPTDDENPGYIDLPFWGRFPVVVGDNYEIAENADEQGQCTVSISFTRAGVSITGRLDSLPSSGAQLENAAVNLEAVAIDDFESGLSGGRLDNATFASGFGQIKISLLSVIGRIQGAQTFLDAMTNEVLGVINLINQGILSPCQLARALFNAGASIVGGIMDIKNSIAMYGRMFNKVSSGGSSGSGGNGSSGSGVLREGSSAENKPSLPLPDNEKNALVQFLSAGACTVPAEAVTVSQEATKTAIENLYRTMAFLVSAKIIANMDSLTWQKAASYWRLIKKLAESIDQENPAVYAAIQNMLSALARKLSGREPGAEMSRRVSLAPLLYLACSLGCDEDKIRELNSVADSFTVEGNVIYVWTDYRKRHKRQGTALEAYQH